MDAGKRDQLIAFKTQPTITNDYGEQVPDPDAEPVTIEAPWARVRLGTAQEKRQAAQEAASQTATFEVDPSAALLAVPMTAFIEYNGSAWDITEKAPLDRQTLRFTATRSV